MEQGTVIAGKYRLESKLAGGGMGSVWKGHDERLDMPVAVKFMHSKLADDPKLRARFEREAKAAAQIRSPHVVHMYDHGIEGGAPYLVMEYLDGEDLNERIGRAGALALPEVKRICTEMCRGLHRAHQLGIIHRDLKPANVFLSAPDDDLVKLLDFGIAKASGIKPVGGETTGTDQILGSPHYLSPEQVRGGALDARSDLWAVAVIVYRMLTGKRPIEGTDLGDLCVRICTDPIAPPSKHRPGLDARVDHFFERAFDREPDRRHQSAKEFAAAFSAVMKDVPIDEPVSVPASDDASSWDPSTSDLTADGPPPTARTRVGPSAVAAPLPTPISASRTLPGERRAARGWAVWGLVGGALLFVGGGSLAILALSPSTAGDEAADKGEALVEPAGSVETISGIAPGAEPRSDAGVEPARSSAEPTPTAEPAESAAPVVRRPAPPRVPVRPTTAPKPAPSPKPAPTGRDPDDIGLGY